ncbi:MAG: GTPase Era [Bacteroidia bacterium]|nr:MAG: GTPase Era [Bacteroidia bacterium]
MHKAGFVNILGNPNVGKSTLMNTLLGEKLSIITPKAQTTRHRILGIANGVDYQIVFSDTPGILSPNYKLQEHMMQFVKSALEDADLYIVLTEVADSPIDMSILQRIEKSGIPVMLLVNKVDLATEHEVDMLCKKWQDAYPGWHVIPVSALHGYYIDKVLNKILELLPESPPFYPKDELTDKPIRFFVAETVREKVLMHYHQEIPYSVEVAVDTFEEEGNLVRIRCVIHVARESQKGIIIGHKGSALKRVGTEARKSLEEFLGKKVFLELHVKVSKNWREDEVQLRRFGYKHH